MGITIGGNVSSGRDTIMRFEGYVIPRDWQDDAYVAMQGLNPNERTYAQRQVQELEKELQGGEDKRVMQDIVSALSEIAPAVAAVLVNLMPFLARGQ